MAARRFAHLKTGSAICWSISARSRTVTIEYGCFFWDIQGLVQITCILDTHLFKKTLHLYLLWRNGMLYLPNGDHWWSSLGRNLWSVYGTMKLVTIHRLSRRRHPFHAWTFARYAHRVKEELMSCWRHFLSFFHLVVKHQDATIVLKKSSRGSVCTQHVLGKTSFCLLVARWPKFNQNSKCKIYHFRYRLRNSGPM